MSLVDITTAWQAQALTDPRVASTPNLTSPNKILFNFGHVFLAQQDQAPRVVWVPIGGTVEGPEKEAPGNNPRQIATWLARVDVYCWGQDEPTTETLCQIIWSAVQIVTPGVWTPIEQIVMPQPDNLQYGWNIMMGLVIKTPITLATDPTATVTSVAITPPTD